MRDSLRIGHGYDVHRLVEGRRLIIGGVDIPYEKGLLGHSDADVLAHAIIDALLGACAMGDIGGSFPDNNNEYKDADSIELLHKTGERIGRAGFRPINIDSTIVAQRPKLAPYIDEMRKNIAHALGIEAEYVSVKATTTEKLGFEGEGMGISAHAVCLIDRL